MLWCRFYDPFDACKKDYRPVIWPVKYPYWCSGESDKSFIIVAYVENESDLYKQWPELKYLSIDESHLEIKEVDKIEFSGRFQKPDWYEEK